MGLSCLSCFGGGKKVRRVDSPEPAPRLRQQVEDEKAVPHPISHSPEPVVEKEPIQARQAPKLTVPSVRSTSIKDVTSSPLSDFVLDLPPSPAVEKGPPQFPEPRVSSNASRKSGESPHRARPPIPVTHPIRTISTASSANSHGSSLRQTSTKATTPPLTPADAAHKTAALPVVARVATPTQPIAQIQADSPTLSRDDPAKVTSAPAIAPLNIQKLDRQPSPQPTSPISATSPRSPTFYTPNPRNPSPPLAPPSPNLLPVRKSSASPIPPPQASPRKPTLDISTTITPRRPSHEFDTPTTATPVPQSAPGALNRVSTAPLPAQTALKEKRKSRLSRFLSTKETGKVAGGLGKRGKSVRHSQAFPFAGQNFGSDAKETDGGIGRMGSVKEVQAEGDGVQRSSAEKAEWERELEAKRVEGRKWKDEEDNDSLFCY